MSRNNMRLSLLMVIVVSALAAFLSFTPAPTASAASHVPSRAAANSLGGVNLRAYCQSLGYANVTTVGSTVYDWRCAGRGNQWILAGIDMIRACTWTHILYSIDIFYNFYDMTSINCIF
jgi:hypothetical protein